MIVIIPGDVHVTEKVGLGPGTWGAEADMWAQLELTLQGLDECARGCEFHL